MRLRRANVRVIAATSAELAAAVRAGRFRADLCQAFTYIQLKYGEDFRPMWPYGFWSALLFGPGSWAIIMSLVVLGEYVAPWPGLVAHPIL